jgi:DNA-binding GntR family transcriptional regulator
MNKAPTDLASTEGSATQRAYQTLRQMIVTGELRPGEKLKIHGLKDRLNTGASPLREALSLLTSDNLVERHDQRGFTTAEISTQNFQEILLLRSTLEDLALRESIANATQEWEEEVVLSHHRMLRAESGDQVVFEQLHKAFHMALLANAASPIMLKYCSQLYDLNIRYRYLAGSGLSYQRRDVREEHKNIVDAVVARDAETASIRLLQHYKRTGDYLAGLLGEGKLA